MPSTNTQGKVPSRESIIQPRTPRQYHHITMVREYLRVLGHKRSPQKTTLRST